MPTDPTLKDDCEEMLVARPHLWDLLRGARVFLTGGTGFVGTWLLELLIWANQRRRLGLNVVVLSRNPGAFGAKVPHLVADPAIRLWRGDVRSFDYPPDRFDLVIHGAAEASRQLNETDPRLMFDTVLQGTSHTLEFASRAQSRRMLFLSSGAVYGRQPVTMDKVAEDYCGGPDVFSATAPYAEAKRAAELLCAMESRRSGLDVTIARCFAFVGPHIPLDKHYAIGNFIRDVLGGREIVIQGDGTTTRSYLYASELSLWLVTILLEGQSLRPYNVGSDIPVTVRELARKVAETEPSPPPVRVLGVPVALAVRDHYVPCVDLVKSELGLSQTIDFDTAIMRTKRWYAEKPHEAVGR